LRTHEHAARAAALAMQPVPSQCAEVGVGAVDVAACDCAAARRHGADDTRSCDRKAGSADDKRTVS